MWGGTPDRTKLKFLARLPSRGNRDHASFTREGLGVPCLRSPNVPSARLHLAALRFTRDEDHGRQSQAQLRAGDIVIVRTGLAGAAVCIPPDQQPYNCVDRIVARRSASLVPRFAEYGVNSTAAQERDAQYSTGALLAHFNAVDAANLRISALAVAEHRHTATALDRARGRHDRRIEDLTRRQGLLAENGQTLISSATEGRPLAGPSSPRRRP